MNAITSIFSTIGLSVAHAVAQPDFAIRVWAPLILVAFGCVVWLLVLIVMRNRMRDAPAKAARSKLRGGWLKRVLAQRSSRSYSTSGGVMFKHSVAFTLSLLLAACGGSVTPDVAATAGSAGQAAKSWRDPVPQPPPPANMPAPNTPQFFAATADEFAHSQGRGLDQQSNLDYLARIAPLGADYLVQSQGTLLGSDDHPFVHDPYVQDWGTTQGQIQDVVIVNRYGAKLNARFYSPKLPFKDPVTGEISNGPFPTLVFIPGLGPDHADSTNDHFANYEGSLEQLAAHGYVVLGVNPQGQGGSEYFAPPSPYCDPKGDWTKPQELGLVEKGPCAGQLTPIPPFTGQNADTYNRSPDGGLVIGLVVQPRIDAKDTWDETETDFDNGRPRFVFPAWDAVAWLSSSQNPWRDLVDESRLGMVGHSTGADAATVAGNGDPQHRFIATVAWDGHGLPPDTMEAAVPSLFIQNEEQALFGPYTEPPHDEYLPAYRMEQRFMADGVDSMLLTLRGSNHYECGYYWYPLSLAPIINVSSKGGAVNMYYTVAWFDRWLKGGKTAHTRGDESVQADDARRRLLARTFDDSTDKTAMGQGTFDPVTQQNVPYKISGENVADHLTFFLHSQVAFDGMTCLDWQAGCE